MVGRWKKPIKEMVKVGGQRIPMRETKRCLCGMRDDERERRILKAARVSGERKRKKGKSEGKWISFQMRRGEREKEEICVPLGTMGVQIHNKKNVQLKEEVLRLRIRIMYLSIEGNLKL
ncbi:unnamed protein product [Vicia faba]|uniref:Uncharacterized protein n=1 Tax=Vicia faba TaxID=3906 RepID=A0AAV1ACY0_VICFA|nr:unnamed protein product [Vicia faba]